MQFEAALKSQTFSQSFCSSLSLTLVSAFSLNRQWTLSKDWRMRISISLVSFRLFRFSFFSFFHFICSIVSGQLVGHENDNVCKDSVVVCYCVEWIWLGYYHWFMDSNRISYVISDLDLSISFWSTAACVVKLIHILSPDVCYTVK